MSEKLTTTENWEAFYALLNSGNRKRLPEQLSSLRQKLRQPGRNQNQPQRAQSNFLADYANNRRK
ncbi:hypothetical protein ACX8XP_16595 [Calditrichota bacterium LG25]